MTSNVSSVDTESPVMTVIAIGARSSRPSPDRIQPTTGRVSEIGSAAAEANAFPVKVALIDAPESVLPGMTAEVSLVLGGEASETAYRIPFSAIAPGEESGRGYVFVYGVAVEPLGVGGVVL